LSARTGHVPVRALLRTAGGGRAPHRLVSDADASAYWTRVTNFYMLFAVAAGAGVAAQAIINARLRFVLGAPVWAACAQFIVGLGLLALIAVTTQQPLPAGASFGRAPWWMWTGGLFGATFIMMSVIVTPKLGTALMMAATIVGQLGAALVIDHYGWFGANVIPISLTRVLGVVLLAAGVILIRWP
jgi:bacterial/archaeal transporter family-2 protein